VVGFHRRRSSVPEHAAEQKGDVDCNRDQPDRPRRATHAGALQVRINAGGLLGHAMGGCCSITNKGTHSLKVRPGMAAVDLGNYEQTQKLTALFNPAITDDCTN